MSTLFLGLQQSGHPSDTALQWRLEAGRALGLRAAETGVLSVAEGRVWATLDGPHGRREGDHVLAAGAQLVVPAGRRLVIEAWPGAQPVAAQLAWRRAPRPQPGGGLRRVWGRAADALARLAGG